MNFGICISNLQIWSNLARLQEDRQRLISRNTPDDLYKSQVKEKKTKSYTYTLGPRSFEFIKT